MTSLAEGVTMGSFDVTDGTNAHHKVTPGHHQLQGTLGVALSVDTRGDGDNVVASSFLPRCVSPPNMTLDSVVASSFLPRCVSPSNMTLDSATTESSQLPRFRVELDGKQLPRCVRFFKRVVTPVVYQFRFCFIIFCIGRWLQLVARDGRCAGCHGRSADVCQRTNLVDLRHFGDCFAIYNEGYFFRGFDRDRVQGQNVSKQNWNMVRHVLRMVTVELRHACALASQVGLITTVPWGRWTTQISASRHA